MAAAVEAAASTEQATKRKNRKWTAAQKALALKVYDPMTGSKKVRAARAPLLGCCLGEGVGSDGPNTGAKMHCFTMPSCCCNPDLQVHNALLQPAAARRHEGGAPAWCCQRRLSAARGSLWQLENFSVSSPHCWRQPRKFFRPATPLPPALEKFYVEKY